MAHKRILFRSEARERILRGAGQLADAIRITLGPKSKSVLIQRRWGVPLVCNDGVTIAREFDIADAEENLGAAMLRQAAEKTGDAVGDGTSTATILAHAILADGVRNVVAGASAIDLKRGLDRALAAATQALRAMSRPVQDRAGRSQVATIAAHNDRGIGELVAEAMDRVGGEGVITVEESRTTETVLDVVEGLQFDRGYISPYFVTDPEKMEAVLEEAHVLVCAQRIASVAELVPVLEQVAKGGRPVLFIAEDVEGEALATLVVNQLRGVLRSAAAKAPGFGDHRRELLQDIAVLTGAQLIGAETGTRLESVTLAQLGRVARAVLAKDATTLVGGGGQPQAIEARRQQIRRALAESDPGYDRTRLEQRLARLSGGVAVVRVGAPSEAEMKARRDALDDAISATRAANAEGIVAGGGLALLRCGSAVAEVEAACQGDERTGVQILGRALQAPARQIAENSAVDAGVVVDRMLAAGGSMGFDAATKSYVDLFEAGIVDATKVVRVALENAVSVASVLLLSEATMAELPEPGPAERDAAAGP